MAESTVNTLNAVDRVPSEIWTFIFGLVDVPHPNSIVGFRQVCKLWRNIIDNNPKYVFEPTVNDKRWTVPVHSSLRVEECVITRLMSPISSYNGLFRIPELLTKLSLSGPIRTTNFLLMATQFTNLVELSLNEVSLNKFNLLVPQEKEEDEILKGFLGQLKKLSVKGINVGSLLEENTPGFHNFLEFMSTDMPELKSLHLDFSWFNLEDSRLPSFLAVRTPSLENIRITSVNEYDQPMNKLETFPLIPIEENFDVPKSLDLCVCYEHWDIHWMPVIRSQYPLQNLKIQVKKGRPYEGEQWPNFIDVEGTLTYNKATLTSVELENLAVLRSGNLQVFQGMEKLNKLVLYNYPKLLTTFSLSTLPRSIQILKLKGFQCRTQEIENMGRNLINLKYFELNGIERLNTL